MAGADNIMLNA